MGIFDKMKWQISIFNTKRTDTVIEQRKRSKAVFRFNLLYAKIMYPEQILLGKTEIFTISF